MGKNASKIAYVFMVITSIFIAVLMKNFMVGDINDYWAFEGGCTAKACVENQVAYRFSLLNVVFFGAMALLTPACEMLHQALWAIKIPVYLMLAVGVFMMNNDSFNDYEEVARVFSIVFLFLQVFLLLEFSFELDHLLITTANKADEAKDLDVDEDKCAMCRNWIRVIYIALLLFIWGSTIAFWVVMYSEFDCSFGHTMTSVVLVTTTIIQIVGNVAGEYLARANADDDESVQGTGMLPCAVGSLYATWLTFSALTSNPDDDCNPLRTQDDGAGMWIGVAFSAVSIGYMGYSFSRGFLDAFGCGFCEKGGCCEEVGDLCCYEDDASPEVARPIELASSSGDDDDVEASKMSRDAEPAQSQSTLSPTGKCGKAGSERFIFHMTLMTCGFYMAMVLTNWAKNPGSNAEYAQDPDLYTSSESMWIKLGSMFLTLALYLWIVFAPFVFPDRSFGSDA